MRSLDEIFAEQFKKRNLKFDKKSLATEALNDPEVKNFLSQNKDLITQPILNRSLSNIYEFVHQKNSNDKIIGGYKPILAYNSDLKIIEIRYTLTNKKRSENAEIDLKKRIRLIDLPSKLKSVKLDQIDQSQERKAALNELAIFLSKFKQNSKSKGLYLVGDFGVGKTYLLAGLANTIADAGYKVVFMHVPSFIASLSRHFNKNTLESELDALSSVSVLIFDDIGAETLSDWSRDDVLGVILQKRMDNELPTFFSSNIPMKELEQHFAETKTGIDNLKAKRLMQRVYFLANEVYVGGPNRRNL